MLVIVTVQCKFDNFMMDGFPLYSSAPHLGDLTMNMKCTAEIERTTRTSQPVRYYAIDFGLSRQYTSNTLPEEMLLVLPYGGDKSVPEFQRGELCDLFQVDVYCVGNFVREIFLEGKRRRSNLEFMLPLINAMMYDDPKQRSTMSEVTVVQEFETICGRLSWWQLRAPVSNGALLLRSAYHWSNQIDLIRRSVPSIPMP
ncbi:hypothetical protein BDQ17DRAFT_1356604 [Cyathus striatus]|nr:hypothetical protein BDQ17DRAFT_1356604 [Cyathus striatus]